MKDFDRIETGRGKCCNSRTQAALSRMRERRDSAGLVNGVNDCFRCGPFVRKEAGPSAFGPPVERLLRAGDVSGVNHRPGHLRPSDRPARLAATAFEYRLDVDRYAMGGEA